jgi:hypothetical protein
MLNWISSEAEAFGISDAFARIAYSINADLCRQPAEIRNGASHVVNVQGMPVYVFVNDDPDEGDVSRPLDDGDPIDGHGRNHANERLTTQDTEPERAPPV